MGKALISIDYRSPDTPQQHYVWPWRSLVACAVVLLGLFSLIALPIRTVESRMDSVTGSIRWRTVWLGCVNSSPRFNASPLELRLRCRGIQWTPTWQLLHNTHRNIFGGATCYECGHAPQIFQLQPILNKFAAASTDKQLAEFVRVMQSGSEAEQKVAIDAAIKKAFRGPDGQP